MVIICGTQNKHVMITIMFKNVYAHEKNMIIHFVITILMYLINIKSLSDAIV